MRNGERAKNPRKSWLHLRLTDPERQALFDRASQNHVSDLARRLIMHGLADLELAGLGSGPGPAPGSGSAEAAQ